MTMLASLKQLVGSARHVADVLRRRPLREVAAYAGRRALWEVVNRRRTCARVAQIDPLPPPGETDGCVLFFTPEAGVNPHFAAQCVLGRTLQDLGQEVLFVRCFQCFSRCPVMDMYRVPYGADAGARTETCLRCAGDSYRMLGAYALKAVDLRHFTGDEVESRVQSALASAPADLRELKFDSIAFGRLTVMDLVLANKVSEFHNVPEPIRVAWLSYIENSIRSYLMAERLLHTIRVKSLVHFNDYSLMLGARLAAQKQGVPVSGVTLAPHRNIDRRRFVLLADVGSVAFFTQRRLWPAWRDLALPPETVREVGTDLLVRLGARGSHTYSPAKTFRQDNVLTRLGFEPGKKVLVAYTSSLDEMIATDTTREGLGTVLPAPPQPFADQIEWLAALVEFVEGRDDLQLAVRIHPREGANKREQIVSQHLLRLKARFQQDYRNARFIWPEDKVSSYDLGEMADLALISWSTIGLEMARLGVPVLASTTGIGTLPHDDFMEWAPTPEAYFEKLGELLARPMTLDVIARAFRWYNLYHLGLSIDLGDVVPTFDHDGLPRYRPPREARTVEEIVVGRSAVQDVNRERLQAMQRPDSERAEREAIQQQLRRFLYFLMTGADTPGDYRLALLDGSEPGDMAPAGARVLLREGPSVTLRDGRRSFSRFSPMCSRLAQLCAQDVIAPLVATSPSGGSRY
jgi:hypothetical protein